MEGLRLAGTAWPGWHCVAQHTLSALSPKPCTRRRTWGARKPPARTRRGLGYSVPLCFSSKWNMSWASEMARQVRALTAKLENLSLNPVSVGVPGHTNHEERTPKSE